MFLKRRVDGFEGYKCVQPIVIEEFHLEYDNGGFPVDTSNVPKEERKIYINFKIENKDKNGNKGNTYNSQMEELDLTMPFLES